MADEIESTVNVNEDTSSQPSSETHEVVSGDMVTFDDLERITTHHKETKKEKKEPTPKKTSEEEDGVKAKGEKKDESGTAPKDDKAKEPKDKEETPKRVVKAKDSEGKETEYDLDAKVSVKVNGAEQEVTLEELRNNYTGKKAWSEEFSKLGTDKQKFKQERDSVNAQLKDIFETSKKDGVAALMKMAEFSGLDPVQWRKDFHASLMPQLEAYRDMSEDERQALELTWERDHYKGQAESQSKRTEDERSFKEFETKVRGLQQTHQVSDNEFETTYAELARLQERGEFKGDLNPEKVIEVVRTERIWTKLDSVFADLKLTLDDAKKMQVYKDLTKLSFENNLSLEDVADITREAWGQKKSQNISRKLQKSGEAEKIAPKKAPINPSQEPWSFEEL